MESKKENVIKREKRIIIYVSSGFLIFSVLAMFSGHPELFCGVLGLCIVWLLRIFLFNCTSYPVLYQKYKRGELKSFPIIQLGVVILTVVIVLIVVLSFLLLYHRINL